MDLVLSDDEYTSAAATQPAEERKPVLYIQHSTLAQPMSEKAEAS